MILTLFDKIVWLAGFLGHIALLGILLSRRRYMRFPFFTAYIAFAVARTVINYAVYREGTAVQYFWTYSGLITVDALLQLSVIYEMAREVLHPGGRWVESARTTVAALACTGAVMAAGLSFAVHPMAANTVAAWSIRLNLFTSLLIAELVITIFLTASRMGLQWRNYVMGLAEGMAIWICISLCVDTVHSYWGWTQKYLLMEQVRMVAYLLALAYWCVTFWRAEPSRTAISPDLKKYLYAIGHSLEYDLREAGKLRKEP